MGFRNFRLHCLWRVISLLLTSGLLAWLATNTNLYATMAIVTTAVIIQTWALLRYIDATNRDLARFLVSVQHADFSASFLDDGRGGSHRELRQAFDDVLRKFREARGEKEEHFRYLQTVIQHISVGLLAFDPKGRIDFVNMAARRLLGIPRIKTLDSLARVDQALVARLYALKPGRKLLTKIELDGELLQLSLSATEFRLGGRMIKLVSLQNIASELAEREMEAWQQLVRVLTHEIINSVTPIASLASTARSMLGTPGGETTVGQLDDTAVENLSSAVGTIEKRSEGLIRFVQSYRRLSRIPKPSFRFVTLSELFGRVRQLVESRPDAAGIVFACQVAPETLELTADPDLIEQVLLNLMLNSVQALAGREGAAISLGGHLNNRGRVIVTVTDNGPGIEPEALESIFIPFFTTKPEGTGIGLSLSRQIMRLHSGEISAVSAAGKPTVFTLRF